MTPPFDLTDAMDTASDEGLRLIMRTVGAELDRRRLARYVARHWRAGALAMAQAMAGVAHAMVCRAFLRHSKGLLPFASQTNGLGHRESGGTAQHGRMWTASEGAEAHRASRWYVLDETPGATLFTRVSPLALSPALTLIALLTVGYPWPTAAQPLLVRI